MRHTLRLVVGAVLVLAASSALAQAPTSEFFPLKAKSKWVLKVNDQTVEIVVAGTEKIGTDEYTKLDVVVGGQVKASELVRVTADGVYRAKVKEDKIEDPVKILALPVKKDTTWKFKAKVGSQMVMGELKIKEEKEKVKVPAGEFEAVLVEGTDLDIAGSKATLKMWFVKDRGIVKEVYSIQGVEATLELKEYVEGK